MCDRSLARIKISVLDNCKQQKFQSFTVLTSKNFSTPNELLNPFSCVSTDEIEYKKHEYSIRALRLTNFCEQKCVLYFVHS